MKPNLNSMFDMSIDNQPKPATQLEVLSLEDCKAFVDALLNPPKPNKALKTAVQRYERVINRAEKRSL
ncbi:hypothetical protein LEP3755_49830 [Leptolyngbya sp. NIES-3755]|nr:hypothetical protein LEP3755_49830 [Leptolyngbya sp. NIES-3755]